MTTVASVGNPRRGELVFERVSKSYGRGIDASGPAVVAAHHIDLAVGPGESVGIIGPNGAGKTTLLRLAAGITAPDAGVIRRFGRTTSVIELGVGLHPDLTGLENLEFVGAMLGLSRAEIAGRRDEVVEFSGLGHHLARPVKHYSTGMLARLSFSLAVSWEPDLLLLDEVLSVGDLEFRERCRRRLRELHSEGTSVVVVSHDLTLITQSTERAIHLDGGRVVADGPSTDVVGDYVGGSVDGLTAMGHVQLTASSGAVDRDAPMELRAEIELHRRCPDLTARIEMLMPQHPYASYDALLEGPLVFGEEAVELGWEGPGNATWEIAVDASIVPPGAYQARLVLDAPGWVDQLVAVAAIRVAGDPPMVPTALVHAEWELEELHTGDRDARILP